MNNAIRIQAYGPSSFVENESSQIIVSDSFFIIIISESRKKVYDTGTGTMEHTADKLTVFITRLRLK